MRDLPPTLQTTYANLLQAHLNRPAFDFDGAPFTRVLSGKTYWYANQRVAPGTPLKQRYLGPDTDEMRTRIEEMRTERKSLDDFRDYASGLVAQLRAGGIEGPGRKAGPILRALANSGAFRLGGTLVGTHAFRHYGLTLGVHLWDGPNRTTETDDIDIASFERLSMAIGDAADPDIAQALTDLGFKPAPSLNPKTPTSWMLPDASYSVDFLTPSFKEREAPTRLAALKMWAQGLHYLNFLIADPIDAVTPYMEGLLVKIPRPERYAVHKLIISQRRRGSGKSQKDIAQARAIIWAMADHQPYELKQAIADADAHGEKWRAALDRALAVTFAAPRPVYNGERDVIRFQGSALGNDHIHFAITGEALKKHFAAKFDLHETATANRSKIEALMQRKFRTQPSHEPIVQSHEVEALAGQL